MHPALRKDQLFFTKDPHFPLFFTKHPPISFPAYGPAVARQLWAYTLLRKLRIFLNAAVEAFV